ncbi:MAG: diguanylate cyclase [Burkholderiales bacterium]
MFPALSVSILGDVSPWQALCDQQPWRITAAPATEAALTAAAEQDCDLLLWAAPQAQSLQGLRHSPVLATVAADRPVLVLVPAIGDAMLLQLVRMGVDDVLVLPTGGLADQAVQAAALARAVQVAVARKRMAVLQRKGGSIDVATGLPTRAQWLDHLNQLCALREREPAPMAVLVLRVQGTAQIEQQLGAAALALVQRKLAVRLRAALRASDVVGTVAQDCYAVLLSWMESGAHAELVAAKLLRSLEEPVRVGTDQAAVAVSTGIAHHGADGTDGLALLSTALSRAGMPDERRPRGQHRGLVDQGRGAAANDADSAP